MEEDLKIKVEAASESMAIIALEGYINMDTSEIVENQIQDIFDKHSTKNFIFNFEKVEYVSSAGIGIFMDTYDKVEEKGGKICFLSLSDEIRRVFTLVGFMEYFGDVKSMSEAVSFIG